MSHSREESDKIKLEPMGNSKGENGVLERDASLSPTSKEDSGPEIQYFKGIRFYLIVLSLVLALFLANFEIPVVTTSLVGITNDLGGLEQSAWVISAYLLGYVGSLVIFAKLSDVIGRKSVFLVALLLFIIFSGACGAAQTLAQLIIFRAFQGLGAGGCYALSTTICTEIVPKEQYAALTAFISAIYSISMITGPLVGGAITKKPNTSSWRWAFLLNVPAAAPALVLIFLCIPRNFPYHGNPDVPKRTLSSVFSKNTIARIDFIGSAILVIGSLSLVAALEEAGLDFGWKSAFVITLLCVSGVSWILFVLWSRHVTLSPSVTEPVYPWRFFTSRIWMGMTINSIFLGACYISAIFQLPQRFQVVHGISPIGAGVRVIAFTGAAPISSIITAIIAKKGVPPIYIVIVACCLQIVGFVLLGTLPKSTVISKAQYGYQTIAGFGCGTNISLLVLMTPFSIETRDYAVAMGALAQVRLMGSAIGVSIVNTVMHGFLKSRLRNVLDPRELNSVLNSAQEIRKLNPQKLEKVILEFSEGYNIQMKILAGLAAVQLIATFLMWQKKQIKV